MDRFNLINKKMTGKDKDEGVVDSHILTFTKKKNISEIVSTVKTLNPKDGDIFFVHLKDSGVESDTVKSIKEMLSEAFDILRVNCLAIVVNFEIIVKKIPGSSHINIFFPENLSEAEKMILSESIKSKTFLAQPEAAEPDHRERLSGNLVTEKPLDLSVLDFRATQALQPPTALEGSDFINMIHNTPIVRG